MLSAKPSEKIRVMLVDDHIIVRMGLSFAINNQPDMAVIAQAEDGIEAIEMLRHHQPDVVILDLRMPKRNGIETISAIRQEFGPIRMVVLSNYGNGDEVSAALKVGASGFISKDTSLSELLDAIRKVHAGDQVIPSEIARRLASRITSQLSTREFEVLALIGRGLSNKEIGSALNVAESTVKVHVTNILTKLEVTDRTQAVLTAIRRGIIQV